ncbi:uncharacterized protein I303_106625 [Kwoniella dejecticola CBS 10117]|uniref:RING-type domain-containing protein n=1 Tax=Kwoniella dejecticola CBS 10117 TaxID=1296121 RepID=A0A1A5ZU56_9TREE|nr:uncharacterized protein I303_08116 [Kwoniella dejecticola CBS 10117]OBR81346.1 hypothetical protein I303_08116 [Kwoniella dejecticola CBS 10117]
MTTYTEIYLAPHSHPLEAHDVPRSPSPSPLLKQGFTSDDLSAVFDSQLPDLGDYPFIEDGLDKDFGSIISSDQELEEELIIVAPYLTSSSTHTQDSATHNNNKNAQTYDTLPLSTITHEHKPDPSPVILRDYATRLSSSFISLSSPLLGSSYELGTGTIVDKLESERGRSRLTRSLSSPLPLNQTCYSYHTDNCAHNSSSSLDPLVKITDQQQPARMSFRTPEGQSSFDFGDESPNTSTWRGLRRALSMGSNASSSIGSKRSSTITRLSSRQSHSKHASNHNHKHDLTTVVTASNSTSANASLNYNANSKGKQNAFHVSETDLPDIRDVLQGERGVEDEVDIEDDWHNNMVIWKAGESSSTSINSIPASRSINTTGTGAGTGSSHRDDVPSGPSSPCDTDRFSLSDYTLGLPFPKPPSIIHNHNHHDTQEQEQEQEHEHTITIQSLTNIPSHLDSSPIDPNFPFHSTTQTQTQKHTTSSSISVADDGRITPVSIVSSGSQSAYCPPSPALTPSPQLSSSNSPILTTPAVHPSPAKAISTLKNLEEEEIQKDIQLEIDIQSIIENTQSVPLAPKSSGLPPLIPRNITPPSGSTGPLSFPSRPITFTTSTSTSTTVPIDADADDNADHSAIKRTITETENVNNKQVDSLQPPIVLDTQTKDDLKSTALQSSDSMTFGERPIEGRERDWAYDNQDTLDPHPPQPATVSRHIPPPLSYHPHHKAQQPSVPFSTRTTSTVSGGHNSRYSGVDPLDTLSPPPSYGQFSNSSNSSRRNSKYTAFSGSSGSSTYSYSTNDSFSFRGNHNHNNQQHWQFGGQPDISTVFEEENSADYGEDEDHSKKDQYEFGVKQTSLPNHQTHGTLHTGSSATLVNRPNNRSTPGYFSRERSGTVSSQAGTVTSNHSGKSSATKGPVHPFANAVVRPTSPPSIPTSKSHNNFLSPQAGRRPDHPSLQSSRSSPDLAEQYKMSHPAHQVALVSTEDDRDDEETCPVCVESLSFTYRLPGEKPHIVPGCGHALHEECFVTVYGDVPPEGSKKVLGVCGVCRQPMKMADGATKRDKLAMLMGQPGQNGARKSSQSAPSARSVGGRGQNTSPTPADPNADDPVTNGTISSSRSMHSEASQPKVVVPSISIRSEFPSIAKGHRKGKQVITAMVTVEVPSAGDRGKYPTTLRPPGMSRSASTDDQFSPQLPPSPRSASDASVVPSTARSGVATAPDPFAHVVHDLKHRVVDYKTSGLDQLGSLRLFDLLSVRKGQLIREFHVYLFQEALICVSEEKKSGFRGIFSSSSSVRSDHSGGSHHGRGVLKLKGRIYVRHVKKVIDSSVQGEMSLTITMEDESLDSFILCFKDRSSHETWRSTINRLLDEVKGGQLKPSRMPRSANTPLSAGGSAHGFGIDLASPSTAGYAITPSTSSFANHEPTPGDLAFEQPLGPIHTPIDLVIVLSLPAPSQSNNQLPLKVKLMKSSLSFILALLGPKDRISLVTCEMGVNGIARKTPFLTPCRYESRKRLEAFVETLGSGREAKDDFEVQVGREERYDVVTAVNVALDVVLQRKAKNPISSMILISDTSDVIKRAQMDLVTARLDAANVPVHALGYGRSHDPSPLWMISNHTHGTYTFVKEWYHLRDTLAGVVGGLMSIAMDNMKLHLTCQENEFHVTKVSGTTQAIVSKNGKDVDIELRELRYGEIREILVELDLEGESSNEQRYSGEGSSENGQLDGSQHGSSIRKQPSFNVDRGLGLDTLSVGDANALRDVVYEDALIDEVPVVEVDCSFHDPRAGRSVARLAHPVLLTVAILPPNAPPSSTPADPMIVRRRMELLASDMITRALLIASRKNFTHASRILRETKRIIETIVDGLRSHINGNSSRSKREAQTIFAIDGLLGTIQDLDGLLDGLEEHKELFERDHRNYSAQQAGVLRAQRSWTTRTPTERNYCTKEIGEIIQLSGEWQGRS